MGGMDDLFKLMRRRGSGGQCPNRVGGEAQTMRAEQASKCGDSFTESCGQPADSGEAVRSPAATCVRAENRFSPLCLLMNSILPGAVHQDLAGEKTEKSLSPAGGT
jgi:hypothetical protein